MQTGSRRAQVGDRGRIGKIQVEGTQVPNLDFGLGDGMDSIHQPALDCALTTASSEAPPMSSNLVSAFLSRNAWRYLEVQRTVFALLEDFRASDKGRNILYDVYSRADKQRGHEPMKEAWQIKEKVNRERGRYRAGFAIQDVVDIIALTAVCPYPSGLEEVSKFLRCQAAHGVLHIVDEYTREDERGYRAQHVVVGLCGAKYAGIKCEVQIRTILHDAWAMWTHDVTYKPEGSVPLDIYEQMVQVSKLLSALDESSEILRRRVEREWRHERKLKEECTLHRMRRLVNEPPAEIGRRAAFQGIVADLTLYEATYEISDVLRKVEAFKDRFGYDFDAARLMTTLAVMQNDDDLDYLALNYIERWAQRDISRAEAERAVSFMGTAYFSFNRLLQAVDLAERALQMAVRNGDEHRIVECKVNLAHYLASRGDDREGLRRERALLLIAEVSTDRGHQMQPSQVDTVGFVKIVFGQTPAEVKEGLDFCTRARRASGDDPMFEASYTLHSEIAKSRLRALEESMQV
jgi:ppGpp synthetase/RelA/SpoT-type nucleotidyltranferase